jgi:glycosyltransferase involved in cell wall biosynthesis
MSASAPVVIVLGPALDAVSGVSTHLQLLFGSSLADEFALRHFQVGSEGRRREAFVGKLLRLLFSPLALAWQILRQGASLVHINTSINQAFWRDLAYLLVAKLCGATVVYQVHGGDLPQAFAAGRGSWMSRRLLHAALSLPDAIVVLAQVELAAYREFLPRQLIVLIANAIALPPPVERPVPDEKGAVPNGERTVHRELRLVYIGRLALDKGVAEALRGLAIARKVGVEATFAIAGSGPDARRFAADAERLGLQDIVRFVGPVFGDDKQALLAQADVLMLPTYHAEGLPYALLEGMAAGLPAITTRIGGIPDVAVEGVHALFVPPHDPPAVARAIAQLAADRGLLATMAAACRRRIERAYAVDRLAGDFGQLYAALYAGRQAGVLGRS